MTWNSGVSGLELRAWVRDLEYRVNVLELRSNGHLELRT